jgi:transposase
MPQALLPLIAEDATRISDFISVVRQEGQWFYFCGTQCVFQHPEHDLKSFRMFTAQLCVQQACTQAQIVKVFGVSKSSVIRSVNRYREQGIAGFYQPRRTRRAAVMTPAVIQQAQQLFQQGQSKADVARELGIPYDTLRKAIDQGRLELPDSSAVVPEVAPKDAPEAASSSDRAATPLQPATIPGTLASVPSDKSTRSDEDRAAGDEMGIACTRPLERVLASLGKLPGGAATQFESCRDLSYGGVLCALPALIENGLFRHLLTTFPTLTGYYTTLHVILLLSYMALCRIRTVERLQYESPGELGKLLGLDRVPEVRCLRRKLTQLSQGQDGTAPDMWAGLLAKDWMEQQPELAGTLYVDGHVRLYHGHQTELPRRYVSRQRLCLRGTTDYWVNDALGQPFFCIERPIDHGILEAIENDIVPRLLKDVPGQPTPQELDADPYRSRFLLIFDREGYSPEFFGRLWREHRIACVTYHKFPQEDWPTSEFSEVTTTMPNGEEVTLKLAERGSRVGAKDSLWMREVRKLTSSGHQTSLISTAYGRDGIRDAVALFSRWCQENFFRYMMEHYALDALSEYRTEEIPDTQKPVVNPAWRELDRQLRSVKGKLTQRQARFAALTLHSEAEETKITAWQKKKSDLREQIEQFQHDVDSLKQRMSSTPKHLKWDEFPEEAKFERLAPSRKRLTDTVKLVCYRAETALSNLLRETLRREDDSRSLLRDLFRSDADIVPHLDTKVLEVRLHTLANPRSNRAVQHLLDHLNAAECNYPGTDFRLTYSLGEPENGVIQNSARDPES